jgi:hypothetical protein
MNVTGGSGLLERERIEKLELQVKELHGRVQALEGRSDRRLCPPQRDKVDARRREWAYSLISDYIKPKRRQRQ